MPGVVIGHALYPINDFTVPASLSGPIATDLLRRELHFKGVAITDDLADPAITAIHTVPDAAIQALRAGADMLYISGDAGDQQAAYVPCCARSSAAASRAAGSTRPWAASCWRSRTTT